MIHIIYSKGNISTEIRSLREGFSFKDNRRSNCSKDNEAYVNLKTKAPHQLKLNIMAAIN